VLIIALILYFFDLLIVVLKVEVDFLGDIPHILIIDMWIIDIGL
jgi:hypothetical protein